ncbi:MAG TPA: 3-dehydroquinate synthase [Clostridiales bacterium]|nr:3-dehydroquinate synthase [Clostridiales bacterium]
MNSLKIGLGDRSYPIYITTDYSFIGECLKKAGIDGKLVVITDHNVDKYQSADFMRVLQTSGYSAEKYVLEPGENSKKLGTLESIYRYLIRMKLDRKSALIAFGGGVVGDITGFAASTYLRGIDFIQVPTTLLAQADSSVGGKTGIDFEGAKNIIGSFYQPRLVYINVNSLRTLPVREMRAGLAEVIKHGVIQDRKFFYYIHNNIDKIFNYDEEVLKYMSKINCSIKGNVVEQDEKENDMRAVLNFGHTIGHAIESVSKFTFLHGECVSVGMIGSCKMSQYMGMISENVTTHIAETLKKAGLPVKVNGIDREIVYQTLFYDKKIKKGKLLFILPKDIGEVVQRFVDDEDLIKRVLSEVIE